MPLSVRKAFMGFSFRLTGRGFLPILLIIGGVVGLSPTIGEAAFSSFKPPTPFIREATKLSPAQGEEAAHQQQTLSKPDLEPRFIKNSKLKTAPHQSRYLKPAPIKPPSASVIDKNLMKIQADGLYLEGERAFFEGKLSSALLLFKQALLFSPGSIPIQRRMAEIYETEGLSSLAFSIYKKISKSEIKTEDKILVRKKLMEIYIKKGLIGQALKLCESLLQEDKNDFSLHLSRAFLLFKSNKPALSLKVVAEAKHRASLREDRARALLSSAYIHARLQNPFVALKDLKELEKIEIYEEALALKVFKIYKLLALNDQAISHLERFQKRYGESEILSQSLLEAYIFAKRFEEAFELMERIQVLGYLEPKHRFYLALFLIEKKDLKSAIAHLEDLRAAEKPSGVALSQHQYFLAHAYELNKQPEKALSHYLQVSPLSLYSLSARLKSALILKARGETKQSLSLLSRLAFSAEGRLSSLQALLHYSSVHWEEGRKTEALKVLNRGLRQRPLQTDMLFLRGFYLKQLGQVDLALQDIQAVLKIDGEHPEALNLAAQLYSEIKPLTPEMAERALPLKASSPYFLSALGWTFFQKGEWKEALYYLNKAYLKNKQDSLIAQRLGRAHQQLKNFEKSKYFLQEALRLKKDENIPSVDKNRSPANIVIPKQALSQ